MEIKCSRRGFLILGTTFLAGCASVENESVPLPLKGQIVDAGPAVNYASDGVYTRFRHQGFFIVRQGEKLFALSAICTHKRCGLRADRDRSFYCPCHGSTFNPDGHVTQGPAKQDLPVFSTSLNESGHLLVTT